MKYLIITLASFFLGCNSGVLEPEKASYENTDKRIDKSRLYYQGDSLTIVSGNNDTLIYSTVDFNEIVDNFPTLYEENPKHPDLSYAESGYFKDIVTNKGTQKHISFASELGQDEYFILYAYFLKKKNSGEQLDSQRNRLLSIYQNINTIYALLSNGGTFFGHQASRIPAYVEFALNQYKRDHNYYDKVDSVEKQKRLYLLLFRQTLYDENEAYHELQDESKLQRYENHLEILDSLITDNFYLKKAKEFQYSNY